ncbi:MAG: deaminase [Nanoarchaeota archaeon]
MKLEVPSWDDYFMTKVYLIASRSKDTRTHIGAVVVGPKKEIRSTGYNSFVRGLDDEVLERFEKGEKDYWFEHAERNAIYNANLMGVSLENCTMYTNGIPCMDCARGVVQSGIKEVVIDGNWNSGSSQKRMEHNKRTEEMFEETKVKIRIHYATLVEIKRFNDGEILK